MATKKKADRTKGPKKPLWTIPGLEKRCQEMLHEGLLATAPVKDKTKNKAKEDEQYGKFCDAVCGEFAEKLDGRRLTKFALKSRLPKLVWTHKVIEGLKLAIRTNQNLEEYRQEHCGWIPEAMFAKKAKFYRGITDFHATAQFIAGMGRLSTEDLGADAENFEFPNYSYAEPCKVAAGPEWTLAFVNGANIGIAHNRLIAENPVRRALSDAQRRGDAAVVISNGLTMDLKKAAGATKVYRAQVSGLHVKPEHLPPSYQAEAARILRDKPLGKVVYMPTQAKFLAFQDAWHKITHKPDGSPEYTGRVIYPLGHNEEELINSATYDEVRYLTILEQKRLEAEIAAAKSELADAYRADDEDAIEKWERKVEALTQERAMTIITNVSDEDIERRRRRMRALLAKKLQEAIPNCEVVSQGSVHLRVGDHSIKVVIPGNVHINDGLLASYVDESGAEIFRDTMARTVVVCHPYALNHRMVGRDDYDKNGQRDSAEVHVAPMCVDEEYLRNRLRHSTKSVHPISKVLKSEQFQPGVLVFKRTNGIVTGDSFPIAKLDNTKATASNFAYPYPETKYIWVAENTDIHFGSRSREVVWDDETQCFLGSTEAGFRMMRRSGLMERGRMPIHIVTVNDDWTQGNHFETHQQPDPRERPYRDIERYWQERQRELANLLRKGDTEGALQLTREMAKFNLGQFLIRGLDWVQPQMLEVLHRHLDPNIDFYSAVLANAKDSKLVIRGISEINGSGFDNRDVAVINFGSGNHLAATVEDALTEGVFYAEHAKGKLAQLPAWRNDPDFLERHVRAPLYSNQYFAWGTVKAPGGYEWGLNFMNSPARLTSWSDPLAGVVNNDRARGDSAGHQKGRVTLKTFGDKHFFAAVHTPYARYFMCAANTRTDLYGERGFPPNNTGIGFVGLPVDGPDAGPVLVRPIRFNQIRDYFNDPKASFDWEKFLPNAV